MLIFLDIDGVLVNRASLKERSGRHSVADAECVSALNHITDSTGAKIVLSSSWRFCGLEEMRRIFEHWKVAGELISMTPDLTRVPAEPGGLYTAVARSEEIQQWLDAAGDVGPFIIIDDMLDMEHLQERLIRTEFERGLTMSDAERAVELLTFSNPMQREERTV